MPGATVLDWSVTPLASDRWAVGAVIPANLDLGLSREDDGDQRIYLIDARGRVYRPLAHRDPKVFRHCLCTPLWLVGLVLRIGETRMLQTAFASLPAGTDHVDVALANTMPFWHIPVMAEGTIPLAARSVDLTRRAQAPPAPSRARLFTHAADPPARRLAIGLLDLQTGPSGTTLTWSVTAVEDPPLRTIGRLGVAVSGEYDGTVRLPDGEELGPLQIVRFEDPSALREVGPGWYAAPPGQAPGPAAGTEVRSGYREASNVDSLAEMVSLISVQRQFQALQRSLTAESDMRDRLIQSMR